MNAYPSRKNAFTLIEMLVVIAIIALLSAIIVPSISATLRRTKTVAGLSNLRQIGLGFTQYALENREMLPYEIGTAGAVDRRTWHVAIAPYLDGFSLDDLNASIGERPVGVYACPNSKNLTRSGNYADYGMNIYINGHEDEQGGFQRRLFHIPDTSKVILAGDSTNCNRPLRPGSVDGLLDRRQGRGDSANILYVDGRVATVQVDSLWRDISGNRQQQYPWGWPGWRAPGN
ncbi:MAG: type II secretion system protein [Verrucomicrobia bacterium]|nr:type II secretion system protein [Verrucomicrobiota bacterium]MCH8512540.1 type II secretion system GspH family protein [Kiritimatiellia bacterium]